MVRKQRLLHRTFACSAEDLHVVAGNTNASNAANGGGSGFHSVRTCPGKPARGALERSEARA
eukprot:150670-Prorocentrum_lima.AAC.1